jgi:hypothetical protein
MNLRDFISETLTQIAEGVKDAQGKSSTHGSRINPKLTTAAHNAIQHGLMFASGSATQLVHFDVALTAIEGTGTKGGIGVFAGAVSLGASGQSKTENASVSRVQFVVPVVLPEPD